MSNTQQTSSNTSPKAKPPGPEFRVICGVAAGRRRGGRAWSGGETKVPEKEMTKALRAALEEDPIFTVIEP